MQALQRQSEVEQAQYELNAAQRRHTAERSGLHQRIADLELQVSETRKEADEYYKAIIQRNLEVASLGNELSALKLELAQKRQPINFGAQVRNIGTKCKWVNGCRAQGIVLNRRLKNTNQTIKTTK